MDEKTLKIIIIVAVYIIISVIIEFKNKNYISEKYNYVLISAINFTLFATILFGNGLVDEIGISFVLFLTPATIIGTYIIFKKNKTYCFKGIDKNFLKENKNEISRIIKEYENNNLDDKSEVFLENNNITFDNVNKSQMEECLLFVLGM